MLQLDKEARARFYGPTTWMDFRGHCDSRPWKKFLFCCDPRSDTECKPVQLTEARSLAIRQLASPPASATAAAGTSPAVRTAAGARSLTLLEFHWPDSGLGNWGSPYTFLEMLPWMRPHALPGCRVVVCTVLRDPVTLYPSLQRHQYDAMREYGREDLRARCRCNLTSCDMLGFVRAFPNFQSWRITSGRWITPPLEHVGHDAMYAAASRLLARVDLVGVTERLDDWVQLLCERAGIRPCAHVGHRNQKSVRRSTRHCAPVDAGALRVAVREHALADVRLHSLAARRFQREWAGSAAGAAAAAAGGAAAAAGRQPTMTLFEEDRLTP